MIGVKHLHPNRALRRLIWLEHSVPALICKPFWLMVLEDELPPYGDDAWDKSAYCHSCQKLLLSVHTLLNWSRHPRPK